MRILSTIALRLAMSVPLEDINHGIPCTSILVPRLRRVIQATRLIPAMGYRGYPAYGYSYAATATAMATVITNPTTALVGPWPTRSYDELISNGTAAY